VGQAYTRTAGSECRSLSLERLCPNVYTIRIVKELVGAQKKPRLVRANRGLSLELPWKDRLSSLPGTISGKL